MPQIGNIADKNILIGITGGIAAYKICELIRMFKKNGANVKTVVTRNALEFVTPLTLETLSQEPVYIEQFSNDEKKPEHIALCDWADLFLIAPASANTIGNSCVKKCQTKNLNKIFLLNLCDLTKMIETEGISVDKFVDYAIMCM